MPLFCVSAKLQIAVEYSIVYVRRKPRWQWDGCTSVWISFSGGLEETKWMPLVEDMSSSSKTSAQNLRIVLFISLLLLAAKLQGFRFTYSRM